MRVTIVIVNYKNWEDTLECLESVFKSDYIAFEVIVVDNSLDNISINKIKEWALGNIKIKQTCFPELVFPEIKKPLNYSVVSENVFFKNELEANKDLIVVKAKSNNGFAAANNIVLKRLINTNINDFVFLLNNDTVISKDTISNLVKNYNKTEVKVAGCVLLEYNNPEKIQSVGGLYHKFFGITTQVFEGMSLQEFKDKESAVKIDYPVGAAMFLSIKTLNKIGLLNESYFLYYEELDWIQRAKGICNTTYFKDCFVYHKGGVSTGSNKKSYVADKYSIINRINFAKKYNNKNIITVYAGVFMSIFKRILFFKFKRGFGLIKEILRNED